uniref:Uncharacterized protein n=1 Tax=Anguilla anguilla TaxID=7936 RepID=A0A0E9TZQ3_ANGAN
MKNHQCPSRDKFTTWIIYKVSIRIRVRIFNFTFHHTLKQK